MNHVNALLMSANRTYAINVLVALLTLGPLPVSSAAVVERCKISGRAAARALEVLAELGLVAWTGPAHYRTNWQLTPAARRLLLDLFALAHALPETLPLPEPLPLLASPADPLQADHPRPLYADDPNPLHADDSAVETPVEKIVDNSPGAAFRPPAGADENRRNADSVFGPSKQGAPGPDENRRNAHSHPDIVIGLRDSSSLNSIQTNNNKRRQNVRNADSGRSDAGTAHVRQVAQALLLRGRPRPESADPFPPDLRAAVERIASELRVPREKVELAVARSPWPAARLLDQLAAWLAYRASPHGASLKPGGFPYLVLARLAKGVECPVDVRAGGDDRYDGYLPYAAD